MTVPDNSVDEAGAIEEVGEAGGDSRKLPALKWASTSLSTRRRSSASATRFLRQARHVLGRASRFSAAINKSRSVIARRLQRHVL